jgi:hypothetical protein
VFRNVAASGAGCKSTRYHQELSPRGTFYDIDTDPCDKLAVAVGQVLFMATLNSDNYDMLSSNVMDALALYVCILWLILLPSNPRSSIGDCNQDKKLSILNLTSGKTVRYLKPEGDVGEPFKVTWKMSKYYSLTNLQFASILS